MAVPEKIRNRTDEIVAALKESRSLSLSDRDDYIEIMKKACEGTNGLSLDEKIQACAENMANFCYLFLRDKLEGWPSGFWPALFRLVERCRWQITIIVLGALALFAYRPEIAGILKQFTPR